MTTKQADQQRHRRFAPPEIGVFSRIRGQRRAPRRAGLQQICADSGETSDACLAVYAARQVKEDGGVYTADVPSDERDDARSTARAAVVEHAAHLRKAERSLDQALNLVGLLLAALDDEADSRAMQIEIALKLVEKKLNKAHTQIGRHDARHRNLSLAYFDLKGEVNRIAD